MGTDRERSSTEAIVYVRPGRTRRDPVPSAMLCYKRNLVAFILSNGVGPESVWRMITTPKRNVLAVGVVDMLGTIALLAMTISARLEGEQGMEVFCNQSQRLIFD